MMHQADSDAPGQYPSRPRSLTEIVDRVIAASDRDEVGLDTLIESFGRASFTPLLLIPAFTVATPLSGIPGLSSLCGIVIALVSAQMIARRSHAWFPKWLLDRKIRGRRVQQAFGKLRSLAVWIDGHTRARMTAFMHRPLIFVPQAICFLSGAAMPFLELVPFSSTILGTGVLFLAIAMLTRDGMLALLGLLPYLGGGLLAFQVFGG